MNLSEYRADIFARLNENAVTPAFWAEADVDLAVNHGLEDLADVSEYYEVSQSINLAANATYYNLLSLCAKEPLTTNAVWNAQTSRWLSPTTVAELDNETHVRWEKVTGPPEKWFVRGLYKLGLFPKPPASSGTITVYHSAIPARLVNPTDAPADLPADYRYALIEYALFELLAQDGEIREALVHYNNYLGYRVGLRLWTQRRTRDRVGVIGG